MNYRCILRLSICYASLNLIFLFSGLDGTKGELGDDGQNGVPGPPGENIS